MLKLFVVSWMFMCFLLSKVPFVCRVPSAVVVLRFVVHVLF